DPIPSRCSSDLSPGKRSRPDFSWIVRQLIFRNPLPRFTRTPLEQQESECVARLIGTLVSAEYVVFSLRRCSCLKEGQRDVYRLCLPGNRIIPVSFCLGGVEIECKLDGEFVRQASTRVEYVTVRQLARQLAAPARGRKFGSVSASLK